MKGIISWFKTFRKQGGIEVSNKVVEIPAVWLAGASCSGCSVSLLNSVAPTVRNLLVEPVLPGKHINLLFHATIMAGQGEPVIEVLKTTQQTKKGGYLLLLEGSVVTKDNGLYCTIGEEGGRHITLKDKFLEMAKDALAVVSIGTCASFGGIPSAKPNPSGAQGAKQTLDQAGINKPVINVPGCPPHPDWMVGTIAMVLLKGLPSAEDLDYALRPKAFYGKLIHDNCPRRAYFDTGQFAKHPSEPGCLYEIGCKGPMTYADCPTRLWNNGVNWCVGAGSPCLGCCEPTFPDDLQPMFEKLTEERVERFKIKTRG